MRWNELSEQDCPIARGLSVVGDRWTLLILRDCFRGLRRFEQFQQNLGVTRHVLSDRLRKLEAAGVLRRERYQTRPERHEYRLTERGADLQPLLLSLVTWADRHKPAPDGPPLIYEFRDSGEPVEPVLCDARTGRRITPRNLRARLREAEPEAKGTEPAEEDQMTEDQTTGASAKDGDAS